MKKVISLVLVTAVLLSGCSSITKVDEDKVKDVSDKITEAIIDNVGKEKAKRQESHTMNAKDLSLLDIKSTVGNININTHDSNEAVVVIDITAQASSKDKAQKLVDEFVYTVNEESNSIVVDTSYKDISLNGENITTDLSITVPKHMESITLSLNVGDIDIKNINGKYEIVNNVGEITIENAQASYNIKTDVGDIDLINVAAVDGSKFKANTGEIKISLEDISDANTIEAETGVGDIDISVPDDSSYKAVINEFMEKERIETNKDEKTEIIITTGVGDIKFN